MGYCGYGSWVSWVSQVSRVKTDQNTHFGFKTKINTMINVVYLINPIPINIKLVVRLVKLR